MFYTLSLVTGLMILIQTIFNSESSKKIGIINSTFINFITSSLLLALLIISNVISFDASVMAATPVYAYIGGFLGAFVIIASSFIIPKMSIFKSTILIFLGQVATGLAIDYAIGFDFSGKKIAGLLLISAGLLVNILFSERKRA